MKAIFLGTGTSVGIPVIGCDCAVCRSPDPRNHRRRTSLWVEHDGVHLVVDTPPDFREQVLTYRIPRIDAVCFTHSHADHIFGLDDIRRFNTLQDAIIPGYGHPETVADLKRVFNYFGHEELEGVYRPRIDFRPVVVPFSVGPFQVDPLPVEHGHAPTVGFLFTADGRRLGYIPDCHRMDASVIQRLAGVDVMILDALRIRPHKTHLSLDESVRLLQQIGAGQSYLVHMCHDIDHEPVSRALPPGIFLSYDGLTVGV